MDQNKQLKLTHANISLLKTFDHVATFVYLLIFLLSGWKQSYHVKQSYLNAWRKGHGNYRMVNLNIFAKFTVFKICNYDEDVNLVTLLVKRKLKKLLTIKRKSKPKHKQKIFSHFFLLCFAIPQWVISKNSIILKQEEGIGRKLNVHKMFRGHSGHLLRYHRRCFPDIRRKHLYRISS